MSFIILTKAKHTWEDGDLLFVHIILESYFEAVFDKPASVDNSVVTGRLCWATQTHATVGNSSRTRSVRDTLNLGFFLLCHNRGLTIVVLQFNVESDAYSTH